MLFPHRHFRRQPLALHVLLGLLLLRALVPAGFMPHGGNPFQLQLCSVGLAQAGSPLLSGHPHSAQGEDCLFGHAPAAGPLIAGIAPPPIVAVADPLPHFSSLPAARRAAQGHRARAPPLLA